MNPEINIYEGKELNTCCVSGISNMNGMGDMVIQQRTPLFIQLYCKTTRLTGGSFLIATIKPSKDSQLSTIPEDGMLRYTINF